MEIILKILFIFIWTIKKYQFSLQRISEKQPCQKRDAKNVKTKNKEFFCLPAKEKGYLCPAFL